MTTLFSGLKIIDLSTVLAGPSVGTFFAELGATVIKVEHPIHPDVTRSWRLPVENGPVSAYFSSVNYGKTYLQLNLAEAPDYEQFQSLIAGADIVLMNFKKGDDIKLRVTDSALRSLNPKLIIGKISGFGSESDRIAYDLILQAETGYMSMNGNVTSEPTKLPVAIIDVLAAHQLKEGLLIALLDRDKSGIARTVEVSLYDAAICSLMNQASNYLMAQHVPGRIGSLHPNIAPYGEQFITRDGIRITFAIGSNQHFERLCSFMNLHEIPQSELYCSNQQRVLNRITLAALLQTKIGSLDAQFILTAMHDMQVPAGQIKNLAEVFEDETAQHLIREEAILSVPTKRVTSVAFKIT